MAGRLTAPFFLAVARFGELFFTDLLADFADAGRRALALDPPLLGFPSYYSSDFPRDFLARVAMILLLGAGEKASLENSRNRTLR